MKSKGEPSQQCPHPSTSSRKREAGTARGRQEVRNRVEGKGKEGRLCEDGPAQAELHDLGEGLGDIQGPAGRQQDGYDADRDQR